MPLSGCNDMSIEVTHTHDWTFEVSSQSNKHKTYLVQLDAEDPLQVCDCQYSYCVTARKLKMGGSFDRSSYCKHVKMVALWLFDNNILSEARKGLRNKI